MKITALALLSLAVLALGAAPASAQLAIGAYTVDGGGGTSSGGSFAVTGTIGQPDAPSRHRRRLLARGGFYRGRNVLALRLRRVGGGQPSGRRRPFLRRGRQPRRHRQRPALRVRLHRGARHRTRAIDRPRRTGAR
ncbi:MAG: hypothetical protein R3F11_22645 [Verrucomicrobiales bacterium]